MQGLEQRQVGFRTGEALRAAPASGLAEAAAGGQLRKERLDQGGFANPRLTRDTHHLPMAGVGRLETCEQRRPLAGTADSVTLGRGDRRRLAPRSRRYGRRRAGTDRGEQRLGLGGGLRFELGGEPPGEPVVRPEGTGAVSQLVEQREQPTQLRFVVRRQLQGPTGPDSSSGQIAARLRFLHESPRAPARRLR